MTNPLYDKLFGAHAGSEQPFLISADGNTLSYDGFLRVASRFAHVLVDQGVQPGERVAVQVHKSIEALAIYTACVQTGAVFLPLNTAYTAAELEYFISDSEAKLVICDPISESEIHAIAQNNKAGLLTLSSDGQGSLSAAAETQNDTFDAVARSLDDLAALLYTSGTTGRSKGAMLTQHNLLSNAETLVSLWQFTETDRLLHALPIYHTHGLFVASNVILLAGASMVFLPRFDLDAVIDAMPSTSSMMGVPTFYTRLLDDSRFTQDLAGHMRLFISGSAPLLAETHQEFEKRTGHRILERYGMTETNMNTSNPYDGDRRAGTVGFPLPGVELIIRDPDSGEALGKDQVGMIEVRGPNVFKGYLNMPEKTAEELRENGFFITGDLGQMDADGYVSIVGRNKDLIITGGFNVYPKEVELLLDEQDGVLESAVVGVPHPDFGEGVTAVLVAQAGQTIDVDSIRDAMQSKLAKFKQPKHFVVLDELPRNTMGKVQKNVLRDQLGDTFN